MKNLVKIQTNRKNNYMIVANFLILLLSITCKYSSSAQVCCLTDSLTINTGYDPTTLGSIGFGAHDPKWKVTGLSPDCALLAPSPWPTPYFAYAIHPAGWGIFPTGQPGHYLSFLTTTGYPTDSNLDMNTYTMTLTRCFNICKSGYFKIDLHVCGDDWISDLNLNGTTPLGSPAFPQIANNTNTYDTSLWPLDTLIFLTSGTPQCLNITVNNYPFNTSSNGSGLGVWGSIKNTGPPEIISEKAGCSPTWSFCSEPPILGDSMVCVGASNTLSNTDTGGIWKSQTISIATIDSLTGLYTGVSSGTTLISYTDPCGRVVTYPITVNPTPSIISGNHPLCVNRTITLVDSVIGGTWTSGNILIATVGASSGIVTGVSAGLDTVYYSMLSGCRNFTVVTINPLPAAIAGPYLVCVGDSIALADATPGGTWTSSNTLIATIGAITGEVRGILPGTVTITYTLSSGCDTSMLVYVVPLPSVITGVRTLCDSSSTTLTDSLGGGYWTTIDPGIEVGYLTGIVYGVSPGIDTITYTSGLGCSITTTVTVYPLPASISGNDSLCVGSNDTLHDATSGGKYTSSNTSIAIVGATTGIVTGVSGGVVTITYTITATGCFKTISVTVNTVPGVIVGSKNVCVYDSTLYTDPTTGGGITWSSSTPFIATVNPITGWVKGIHAGTDTIFCTNSCGSAFKLITVNPLPVITSGPSVTSYSLCEGFPDTVSVTAVDPGGGSIVYAWTSCCFVCPGCSTTPIYTLATGVFVYTVTATTSFGCTKSGTVTVTVNPVPDPIAGPDSVCKGASITLSDGITGGTWTSSNPSVATIGPLTGFLTGITPGTTFITYTLPTGCKIGMFLTVNPSPSAIWGINKICMGSSSMLYDSVAGGTWTSSNLIIATVGATTGIVNGISPGIDTISYSIAHGCSAVYPITVNQSPSGISGSPTLCVASTTTLTNSILGGTWFSSTPLIATVGPLSGIVTGVSPGVDTITYMLPDSCFVKTTVTVNPIPAPITGLDSVCVGSAINLSDITIGGTWISTLPAIATVGLTGIVTGISVGTTTIKYELGSGCFVAHLVTVKPLPSIITGTPQVCVGLTTTLSDSVTGGTWTSSNTSIAIVGATTGIVTGVSVGIVTITYTLPTGCLTTLSYTVMPTPSLVVGPDTLCIGASTSLADSGAGVFTTTSTTISLLISGAITGVATGSAIVTFTMTDGCFVLDTITIDTMLVLPPITGYDSVCVDSSTTFHDAYLGGTWISVNPAIATISPITGKIVGHATGIDTIKYKVNNLCGTSTVVRLVYVTSSISTLPPIIGYPGVCSGLTDTLYDAYSTGTWTSSDPTIATVGATTGIVTGIADGTVTITYTVIEPCGTLFVTKTVKVNMIPYITTKTIVACQTLGTAGLDGAGPGPGTIISGAGCWYICDSSVVRYFGNGNADGTFTWSVIGGTIIHNYGDSIDVFWGIAGITGTIHIYDSISHCDGEAAACVQIIQRPHADFAASATHICIGDNVIFSNLSYADSLSPIVSQFWSFGDGNYSSAINPTHVYTTWGTDTVKLVVKNSCGCTDTFQVIIQISETPGPLIQCPSIVCDSQTVTYSTAAVCSHYFWSVVGGTILTTPDSSAIAVRWDHVDSSGYGTVSLVEPACSGVCNDTTTIRVPVILQSPVIQGWDQVCVGQQYEYSLPLWAATQYQWGVLGHPECVVGYRNDYKLIVRFFTPGTYTIHGWYQNRLALCGASTDKTITVVPVTQITGNHTICQNSTDTFKLGDATLSGTWILSDITGSPVATGTGNSFGYNFGTTGVFLLTASGPFCVDAFTIVVVSVPSTVDSLIGPDTVCLNRPYTYTAYHDVPGDTYTWQAIGGIVSPSSGSANVSVIWTSYGPKQLLVQRLSTSAPYCTGPPTIKSITKEIINPDISGDSIPCANSYRSYNSNYIRGEVYNWSVSPNSLGSIVAGNYTPVATALWNNVTTATTGYVILKVQKCDSLVTDSFIVNVQPDPYITLTFTPSPACPGAPVTFTASAGDSAYLWNFGDGTPNVISYTSVIVHNFPVNTTTGNITYTTHVTALIGSGSTCPPRGGAIVNVSILPGPVAYASSGTGQVCAGDSALIVATVTNNVTGLTYQWGMTFSPPVPGATDTTYTIGTGEGWFCTITASNGCSTATNIVNFAYGCDHGGGCDTASAYTKNSCNTIYLYGTSTGTGPLWSPLSGIPVGGPIPPGNTETATYDTPGVYWFYYGITKDSCGIIKLEHDTIGIVPNFRYQLQCATSGMDSIFFTDYTSYLPYWHIDSIAWYQGTIRLGGGPNLPYAFPSGTIQTVEEIVYGTRPGGTFNCDATKNINLPGMPIAAFTDAVSPICEGVPISFTSTSTGGIAGYQWNFGDGTSLLLQNPQRTFVWIVGTPQADTVTLIVTDSLGCEDSVKHTVDIYENILGGEYSGDGTICAESIPFIDIFAVFTGYSPYNYLWINGKTTVADSIYQSGGYWITVSDKYHCQQTFSPVQNVKILRPPSANITGLQNYCIGQPVVLSDFLGFGIYYDWLRDGVDEGGSFSTNDILPPGAYIYQLIVGVTDSGGGLTCYDTSASDSVHVYNLPDPPTITGPLVIDCNKYQLQLSATDPVYGTYDWSNGVYGPTDTINSGGPYRIWFTDINGCVNYSDTLVPNSVDLSMPYFPTGCYTTCQNQLPDSLFGPPNVNFSYWAWLRNGDTALYGSNSLMSPYLLDSGGVYAWYLFNGLCGKTSDPMNVTIGNCVSCKQTYLAATATCTSTDPANYSIVVSFYSPAPGSSYVIGTDIGPIDPFSGTIPTGGYYSLTLTFSTLYLYPVPDSVSVEILFTLPDGTNCFQKIRIPLPPCSWLAEKNGHTADSLLPKPAISNSLLVFPNPTSDMVTISYNYGTDIYTERSISIYDAMGRRTQNIGELDWHGNWSVDTKDWNPGVYIIRMEADGKTLQLQRLVVVSQ